MIKHTMYGHQEIKTYLQLADKSEAWLADQLEISKQSLRYKLYEMQTTDEDFVQKAKEILLPLLTPERLSNVIQAINNVSGNIEHSPNAISNSGVIKNQPSEVYEKYVKALEDNIKLLKEKLRKYEEVGD